MKARYTRGVIALLLALVIELPMLSMAIVSNAASMSDGKTWAEVVYENVTIEAGGSASKITDEAEQQMVLAEKERLCNAKMTYYGRYGDYLCKELANHNSEDVLITSENTVGKDIIEGEWPDYRTVGYEDDKSKAITLENGGVVHLYYSRVVEGRIYKNTRVDETLHYDPYESDYSYGYNPIDYNNDNKITYGECMRSFGYEGYDSTKNLPIRYRNCGSVMDTTYSFRLNDSNGKDLVHLEGRRNLDDWEWQTTSYTIDEKTYTYSGYVYKYGKTLLWVDTNRQFHNRATNYSQYENNNCGDWHDYCIIAHYNTNSNSWELVDACEVDWNSEKLQTTMAGDGLYIYNCSLYQNFGEVIDIEGLNPKSDSVNDIGSDNGGSEDGSSGAGGGGGSSSGSSGGSSGGESSDSSSKTPNTDKTDDDTKPDAQTPDTQTPDVTTEPVDNIVSVDESEGTAMVKDNVSGGNAKVAIEVTREGSVYRMYDPIRGEHFYTKNSAEAEHLKSLGWRHEESSDFTVVSATDTDATAVYRLYNPNGGGMHFYTEDATEAKNLKSVGWNYEGISHYVYTKAAADGVSQYRLYNPNSPIGEHNWTTDIAERDMLIKAGWQDEGICWKIK